MVKRGENKMGDIGDIFDDVLPIATTALGAGAGFLIGGPAGAAVGAGIGASVGGGISSANAAESAAETQAQASQQATNAAATAEEKKIAYLREQSERDIAALEQARALGLEELNTGYEGARTGISDAIERLSVMRPRGP